MPELDDGADDPPLRPELEELEPEEFELPEPDEPEPIWVEPELCVPEEDPVDDDPDDVPACEDDVPLLCEPGSVRATAPAATTLAIPTVAVVV